MWFTPNIATLSQYQSYFPDELSCPPRQALDH